MNKNKKKTDDDEATSTRSLELVLGIVTGIGADLDSFLEVLKAELQDDKTQVIHIKIADLIVNFIKEAKLPLGEVTEHLKVHQIEEYEPFSRIWLKMQAGSQLCKEMNRADFNALLAISEVIKKRYKSEPHRHLHVYILDSLKRPEEIELLNEVYGRSFVQLSLFQSEEERAKQLISKIEKGSGKSLQTRITELPSLSESPSSRAAYILEKDRKDFDENILRYGQNVGDAFSKGHYFINLNGQPSIRQQSNRLVELLFGYPFYQPTLDEYGMFHAEAAALRSLDLSRQVGAAIMDGSGSIISIGYNDVQGLGRPLHQPEDDPYFDYSKGFEFNNRWKSEAVKQLQSRLAANGLVLNKKPLKNGSQKDEDPGDERTLEEAVKSAIKESEFWDITEFFRSTHAEMSALLNAARQGISPSGCTMYVNTFPCHYCAKHLIAAGIARVVFLHPYPKSKAVDMFRDFVVMGTGFQQGKLTFEPFFGVSPNRYMYIFRESKNTRQQNDKVTAWKRDSSRVKFLRHRTPLTYIQRECAALSAFADYFKEALNLQKERDLAMDAAWSKTWQQQFDPKN